MRIINLSTGWRIHAAPGEHPTAELAAAELYHLLSRIAGAAMPSINWSYGWTVYVVPGVLPSADLAAAELYLLLSRIAGEGTAGGEGGVDFILSHGGGTGDSFRWEAAPGRVELHGESP